MLDADNDCPLCGGELEVENFHSRRELVCRDCGEIIDSEQIGEAEEELSVDKNYPVME